MIKISFLAFLAVLAQSLFIPHPAAAQSQVLETEKLAITTARGNFTFDVEIADEPQERTIGLMNRPRMDARAGMLFVFDHKQIITMWMKNTLISLDMVFISDEGAVITIAKNTVPHSLDIVSSIVPVSYVLELNQGMTTLIGLKTGDKISHRVFE